MLVETMDSHDNNKNLQNELVYKLKLQLQIDNLNIPKRNSKEHLIFQLEDYLHSLILI